VEEREMKGQKVEISNPRRDGSPRIPRRVKGRITKVRGLNDERRQIRVIHAWYPQIPGFPQGEGRA
jgi:hypothetical protein